MVWQTRDRDNEEKGFDCRAEQNEKDKQIRQHDLWPDEQRPLVVS